jgi:methyl-accepting chemotaxis protein
LQGSASSSQQVSVHFFPRTVLTFAILQAAQDVAASKDVLVELFERIGYFFTRLDTYTNLAPTPAMTDIITDIMVEVLRIFGIATKELRRGTASEFLICYSWAFTEGRIEKFLRKLAGMADLESALKKLDRLTQEEARMALAEVLRITHSVRDEVKVVEGKVENVGDKVEDVGDRIEDVGEKVEDMCNNVEDIGTGVDDIGDKVQSVSEKVQVVIDGARRVST